MATTLGISAFYHDSAAALIIDGEIISAAQEERFSRVKGDSNFPISAIQYCLEEGRISASHLDSIGFYDQPSKKFERIITSYAYKAPKGISSWMNDIPGWIANKSRIRELINNVLQFDGIVLFTPHHLAHAASAFYPSPFKTAAILTVDAVGEWATASYGIGNGETIQLQKEMRFPDSLGLLYSAFTYFCGFKVNSGEYKLMGLAPYGQPTYLWKIKNNIGYIRDDGTIYLNFDFFNFFKNEEIITKKFEELFDGPRRLPESQITRREMDLASSIQEFTEEVLLKMARWVRKDTKQKHLCMAGGVALNCVANARLLQENVFEEIWIQPAAGDAGGALGAAFTVQFGYHGVKRPNIQNNLDHQKGSFLGPSFSEHEIKAFIETHKITATRIKEDERPYKIANAIAQGAIVGIFNGRMEFGPRALGSRSIVGDARRADMQQRMNMKIKFRESFRPFAPSIIADDASDYFEIDRPSPYMLFTTKVNKERRKNQNKLLTPPDDLLSAVNQTRSDVPAITHWDYSARIQTVHKETTPFFYSILQAFKDITGCSLVVNTSFNVRGEPIVCTPWDAYRCFMATDMDYLYLEGYWLEKQQLKKQNSITYTTSYELD